MAGNQVIRFSLLGDAKQLLNAFRSAETGAQKTSRLMGNLGRSATTLLTAPIAAIGFTAVKSLGRIEKIGAQTDAALKSTGNVAGVTRKQIEDYAEAIENKTSVEAESIQEGQNLLLTFTKLQNKAGKGNDIFNQATDIMADMSVAMGTDMKSSAMLVGKALNDPIKGVSALSRAGVQFTEAQKAQIKTMVEAGDVMGAQKIVLGELNTQFAGSAEALGNTMTGRLEKVKNSFGTLTETLASSLIPVIEKVTGWVQQLLNWFNSMGPTGQKVITMIIGLVAAIGPMLLIGAKLVKSFMLVKDAMLAVNLVAAINPWTIIIAATIALVILIVKNWDKIVEVIRKVWDWIKKTAKDVWDKFKDIIKGAMDWVKNAFLNWTLPGLILKHWDKIREGVRRVVQFFKDKWNTVIDFFKNIPSRIGTAAAGMWNGIKDAFKAAINWIIGKWNSLSLQIGPLNIPSWIPGIGGKSIKLALETPNIPMLHAGGTFHAPTPGGEGLALLKDRERVTMPGRSQPQLVLNLAGLKRGDKIDAYELADALAEGERLGIISIRR